MAEIVHCLRPVIGDPWGKDSLQSLDVLNTLCVSLRAEIVIVERP